MAVESSVENRNLGASGAPALTVDGTVQPSELGWSASFDGIKWAAIPAVSVPSLGVTVVNFWEGGTVGAVTADQPCSVMIREQRGTATICVSDPSRTASSVVVTWNRPVMSVASADPSVTVLEREGRLQLRIAVGDTAGATQTCVVQGVG